MRSLKLYAAALAGLGLCASAHAQVLYTQDFEVDPTANWTVNAGPSDQAADFFFDYSTVGIPSAPNSGGTTRGMKLQANLTNGIFGGFSVSPTGENFTGTFVKVKFDMWANFNGPFPGGGNGSTNLTTMGYGTVGTSAQWPGGTQDSVWFGATADGGSAADWRAYSTAAPTSYAAGNAVYAAPGGAINNTNAYYAGLGGVSAPAAQLALFPQQTGITQVGTAGMAWHDVEIVRDGDFITWSVSGLLIATIDLTTVTLAGGNISFGHSDINVASSTDPNAPALLFSLIDNIQVIVPEPSALGLVGLGAIGMLRRRRV